MKIGMELLSDFLSPNKVARSGCHQNLLSGVYRELLSASIRRCTLSTSQDPFQADPELIKKWLADVLGRTSRVSPNQTCRCTDPVSIWLYHRIPSQKMFSSIVEEPDGHHEVMFSITLERPSNWNCSSMLVLVHNGWPSLHATPSCLFSSQCAITSLYRWDYVWVNHQTYPNIAFFSVEWWRDGW